MDGPKRRKRIGTCSLMLGIQMAEWVRSILYWKNKENLLVVVLLNCFFMVAKLRPVFALLQGAIHVLR